MFARAAGLYTFIFLGFLAAILWGTSGTFAYVIDDPYIHLALAAHLPWHMGANPGELTNSSSSILFPWLLVPFARSEFLGTWVPLVINFLAGLVLLAFVLRLITQCGYAPENRKNLSAGVAVFILAACNTFSLIFVGMEHTLHVAAVAVLLSGLIEWMAGRGLPRSFWIAFFLAPLLRYEALAFNALILFWFLWRRDWRALALGFALLVVPQIIQSCYMQALGLPLLPTSILAKSDTIAFEYRGHDAMRLLVGTLYDFVMNLQDVGGLFALLFTGVFLVLAFRRRKEERMLALVVAGVTLAHLLFGRFAWFGRYNAYILLLNIMALAWLLHLPRAKIAVKAAFWTMVCLAATNPLSYQSHIPLAAQQVYQQPLQIGRFVKEYWRDTVVAHDVGAISWLNQHDVADMLGLISEWARSYPERMPNGTSSDIFLNDLATTYKADVAIMNNLVIGVYPPKNWIMVATLRLTETHIILPPTIEFYATSEKAVPRVMAAIRAWSSSLPADVLLGINQALLQPKEQ